jgi:hypothetical protein
MKIRTCLASRGVAAAAIGVSLLAAAGPTFAHGAPASGVAGDERPDVTIDATARNKAIESLITQVGELYPITGVRTRVTAELGKRLKSGAYDRIVSAKELRTQLTSELRALSGDQHFTIDYFAVPRVYPGRVDNLTDPNSSRELTARAHNQGIDTAERLTGNIGYIRLRTFEEAGKTGPVIAAAMRFLATTDAMIIDLRYNRGGYGDTVAFLASYFLADPTQLSESRSKNAVKQIWTSAFVPGEKYLSKPVYVLTSERTFSAGEAFAYDLQALKRVVVVGETTRGGANPSAMVLLSDRFGAIIPLAVTRNPITGTNWDGRGVKPDIETSSDAALDAARLAAARALAPSHRNDSLTSEIDQIIREASSVPKGQ